MKPWIFGPFELFVHAESHLKVSGDADKRMALIGFDNVVETSVLTFLDLHPDQRGGLELQRADVDKWRVNFHSKLDFVEWLCAKRSTAMGVPRDELLWYHNLRNSLYHAGNGFVPAIRHIQGARSASKWVMEFLFGIDVDLALKSEGDEPPPSPPAVAAANAESSADRQIKLLEMVEACRDAVASFLQRQGLPTGPGTGLPQLTAALARAMPDVSKELLERVAEAIRVRNRVAHGARSVSSSEIEAALEALQDLLSIVDVYAVSFEMLPQLQRRYSKWIRPELTSVRIVKKAKAVFLELVTKRRGLDSDDESILRTELSFITSDGEKSYFDHDLAPDVLARLFIEDFDAYSIIHCTDLFTEDGAQEVVGEHERLCNAAEQGHG